MTITLDGPAGVGKSTVARLLAARLGFANINSGALYRAVAWMVLQSGTEDADALGSEMEAAMAAQRVDSERVSVTSDAEGAVRVQFDGADITADLRSDRIEQIVPMLAQRPRIRAIVTELQRRLAANHDVVVEGRDAGTVVFPDADLKFYLTADLEHRAQRRFLELRLQNRPKSLAECGRDIVLRDEIDQRRSIAPLRPAPDAIIVSTSGATAFQTLDVLLGHVAKRFPSTVHEPSLAPPTSPPALIAVSGLIGVGKSTLCGLLNAELRIPVYRERPDDNPYISRYYQSLTVATPTDASAAAARWRLHSQMWFLYRKYELLSAIWAQRSPAIIDRTVHEDYLFARILLEGDDLALYESWYRLVLLRVPQPKVVISLEASVPELAKRIERRGRWYERNLSTAFLERLDREYRNWIAEHAEAVVMRIDTEKVQLEEPGVARDLANWVRTRITNGAET